MQTERDVSVRQRAVDLLYAMCDRSNAEEIVGEMLEYLETADYSIREEMVTLMDTRELLFACIHEDHMLACIEDSSSCAHTYFLFCV